MRRTAPGSRGSRTECWDVRRGLTRWDERQNKQKHFINSFSSYHKSKRQGMVLHTYLKLTSHPNHTHSFGRACSATKSAEEWSNLAFAFGAGGWLFSFHPMLSIFFSPSMSPSVLIQPSPSDPPNIEGLCLISRKRASKQYQHLNALWETKVVKCPS